MSAGLPDDMQSLNLRMGRCVLVLRDALNDAAAVNAMLTNEVLFPATATFEGMGYDDDTITSFKAAFFALNLLRDIAFGAGAQNGAEPSNYFFDAQRLTGFQ